ncbi:unnamed protein product [Phytophthora lilii]|uniref:Unnamed protein product n=1 Tax=Phytophthora lilii TaxID=2077276 RepID=A0A9W6U3P5_9STRA|nr:unnamed protein product [Phytophthora lilii]
MSTQGDLYAKTSHATFTMADLPKGTVLSMPRVARGDLVKVLDLVQCTRSEGQSWELVFTRWRNGMETWLPLEVVQLFAPTLLQEFYVNSINSWAFHGRVQPGNLSVFRTEVELWLFHPEFQEFYKRLRERRVGGSAASQSQQRADQVRVKPEQSTTAAVNTSHAPLPQVVQPPAPVLPAPVRDPSESVIQEFELRRLARERQEQLDRTRRSQQAQLQQQQQQQAEERIRSELEQLLKSQEEREQERRLQNERQRQKAHEVLQQKQKEYQQRVKVQQEREKVAELRRKEQERQQRAKEQENLRQRLQSDQPHLEQPAQKQTRSSQHTQDTTAQPHLPHKQRKKDRAARTKSHHPNESDSSSIWTKNGDDEYIPPEASDNDNDSGSGSEDSDASADSEGIEDSVRNRPTRKRRRKRLLYSQVELDDEDDDDLPDLSQPPPRTRRRRIHQSNSEDCIPAGNSTQKTKKRKRLRQSDSSKKNGSANVEVDLTQLSDDDDDEDDVKILKTTPVVFSDVLEFSSTSENDRSASDNVIAAELIDDGGDDDAEDDIDFELSMIIGEIRCVCGATSVEGYRGQWLQCWQEDCGVWEHADCVGFLTSFETYPPPKYLCTRCDPQAYLSRCVKASHKILDWLFQCCDSKNSKQLMELLKDNTGASNIPEDWKNENYGSRTLAMQAARNGLGGCLRYLLDERKVDIFATDFQSRNALHHAAMGESLVCCRILLKHDRKLLLHQDLRGCMPFHCMLQSAKVNRLCIPFMEEDAALIGMGDLDSNFPVHYACQAVNRHTTKICQLIFNAQPSMLTEKSKEGLYPLMILCKASGDIVRSRNKSVIGGEVTKSAKDIVALMLDIDVFGDCMNQRAPNGWAPLHFAAASGNHELVTHLCKTGLFDVQQAVDETGQTALHIAAQENRPQCVRALLLEGLNVVAKDTEGWIPVLYAEDTACLQEFIHYKLTKQLSRLHRMLSKYQQRGLVHQWQRRVAQDPTCFDILNDWCRNDTERIERMDGLFLSNPFLLRLDNKLEYVSAYIIPSIKKSREKCAISIENGKSDVEKHSGVHKKIAIDFSRGKGCFWKQFVGMGMKLEPEDFRFPIIFSIERGGKNSQGAENRESNLKLVLIRLAAGLLKEAPGLLERGGSIDLEKNPLSSEKQKLASQLLGYYLLGELVAHFVLFAVPLSGILDFTQPFLRCIACKGRYVLAGDERWEIAGRSFAAGFEAVLPATLELFHADGLRVLFNGPETTLNALQIDWNTAVDWNIQDTEDKEVGNAKVWLPRLMNELVKEEQQLVLLFMTGTFQQVNDRFFRSDGESDRISVALYPGDSVLDHDTMYPTMERTPDILRLPSYSCYDAFKKAMLTVIRHVDRAFLPE